MGLIAPPASFTRWKPDCIVVQQPSSVTRAQDAAAKLADRVHQVPGMGLAQAILPNVTPWTDEKKANKEKKQIKK